jgi:2-iminobutanoate/2-iminopropanoate deaminase
MSKHIIKTDKAPDPIGPYSQAVMAGNLLFVSGQISLVPGSSDVILHSPAEETHRVMENIKFILNKAGLDFPDIVKTTIFLTDMSMFGEVNEAYSQYFKSDFPARETVAVSGLPKGVNVEISVTALKS